VGAGRLARAVFPYVEQPVIPLGRFQIAAFQILVCFAVILGHEVVVRRARRLGFDPDLASSLVSWTIVFGFVGSHLFDVAFYFPAELRRNPLLLLQVWGSMSSFGGILAGLAGGWWISQRKGLSGRQVFAFVDILGFGFPFAWIFGRAGCALAHDHRGIASTSFLAVRFPDGPHFDLGLLELLYTIALAALFLVLDRRPRPTGFFVGLFFTLYGPVRFALDTLRTGDERYLGWTPGQYASVAAALFGVGVLLWVFQRMGSTQPQAPPASP
jgi:phosphatidylglycerol:prolipoprotein diacylglycerol transferase